MRCSQNAESEPPKFLVAPLAELKSVVRFCLAEPFRSFGIAAIWRCARRQDNPLIR